MIQLKIKSKKPKITIPDMTPRRLTGDEIINISDDRIQELSEDYYNAEMGRWE